MKCLSLAYRVGWVGLAATLLAGCTTERFARHLRKGSTSGESNFTSGAVINLPRVDLNRTKSLTRFAPPLAAEGIRVFAPAPAAEQARRTLAATVRAKATCRERLGVVWRPLDLYLLPTFETVSAGEWKHKGATLAFPLFTELGPTEELPALRRRNEELTGLFLHELVEGSLFMPFDTNAPMVLGDPRFGPFKRTYGTRWFREGMATWGALLCQADPAANIAFQNSQPLKALQQAGSGLLAWSNVKRHQPDGVYYPAALGLFLWFEHQTGPGFARRVMDRMRSRSWVQGAEVRDASAREAEVADLSEFCRTFRGPWLGFEVESVDAARAVNAGLTNKQGVLVAKLVAGAKVPVPEGSVILRLNGRPLAGPLGYELALLQAGPGVKVTLEIAEPTGARRSVEAEVSLRPTRSAAKR